MESTTKKRKTEDSRDSAGDDVIEGADQIGHMGMRSGDLAAEREGEHHSEDREGEHHSEDWPGAIRFTTDLADCDLGLILKKALGYESGLSLEAGGVGFGVVFA